jgi:hypothetical protein
VNLQLHQRSEQILQRDPEVADAWRARRFDGPDHRGRRDATVAVDSDPYAA